MSRLPVGVRRRGDRLQARWRDALGRERSATFASSDEAAAHLIAVRLHDAPTSNDSTVEEWCERVRKAAPGRPSTKPRDESYLRTHFLPVFGERPIAEVTSWELQEWVAGLDHRLAAACIHKVHGVAAKVSAAAVSARVLTHNSAREVRLPTVRYTEARFLTLEEASALEDALVELSPHWREVVPFLLDTGLRIGEMAGLTVGDVDTANGIVRVRQGLVEVRGHIQIGPPKSQHAARVVPMLREPTAGEVEHRVRSGELRKTDPLFSGRNGGWLRQELNALVAFHATTVGQGTDTTPDTSTSCRWKTPCPQHAGRPALLRRATRPWHLRRH